MSSPNSRQKGGTGLGLAISTELMERMSGRGGFDSQPGSGGTFGFPALSRQAHGLETQAGAWLDAGVAIPASDGAAWKSGVLGLRRTVSATDGPGGRGPGP